jgi:hypothetical protein
VALHLRHALIAGSLSITFDEAAARSLFADSATFFAF